MEIFSYDILKYVLLIVCKFSINEFLACVIYEWRNVFILAICILFICAYMYFVKYCNCLLELNHFQSVNHDNDKIIVLNHNMP